MTRLNIEGKGSLRKTCSDKTRLSRRGPLVPGSSSKGNMNLLQVLDRPIAFHRIFAELTGSVSAGLMLSQAVYWSGTNKAGERRTANADGWFYKSQQEWFEETMLTRKEQETARKHLRDLGSGDIWVEEMKGMPRRLFYRLDLDKLQLLILDMQAAQKGHASMSERDMQAAQKGHAINEQRLRRDYTETTTTFFDNRAPRLSKKKKGVRFSFDFSFEALSGLFTEHEHAWLVANCPRIETEAASRAFLAYHNEKQTGFRSARAVLAAWRGWMARAEGRAGAAPKNSITGRSGLNAADLESLRLAGIID